MERLTNKAWRNFDPCECCGQDKYCQRGCHDPGGCTKGCIVPRLYARLGAYEDTELTPEEVSTLVKDWSDLCTIVGECGGISRVRVLAEADKDGRVAVLPCKVGDTVYLIVTKRARIYAPEFRFIKKSKLTFLNMERVLQDFGKTVFLTREEAEKALEAKKDG